jgi:hypothetical protein
MEDDDLYIRELLSDQRIDREGIRCMDCVWIIKHGHFVRRSERRRNDSYVYGRRNTRTKKWIGDIWECF